MIGRGKMFLLLAFAIWACCASPGCRKESAPPAPPASDTGSDQTSGVPASRPSPGRSILAARHALAKQMPEQRKWEEFRTLLRSTTQPSKEPASGTNTHIAAGLRALRCGDNDAAAQCFYRAFRIEPSHMGVLYGLSESLLADGKYAEAVPICEMIVGLAPEDEVSQFNLAVVLSRLGRFGQAEKVYRRLLANDGGHVQAQYNLATLYQAQGKLADARDTWMRVVAAAGHLPSAQSALAEVQLDLGDPRAAMLAYAEAAKLRPKEVSAWVNLAAASRAAGSCGRAVVAMSKALDLAPMDAQLWAQLGELQLELHRRTGKREFLRQAIVAWRKSLQLDPTRRDIRDWLQTYEAGQIGAVMQPAD